jgi:uncharacterized protein YndB with AHSA1/START domain
LAIVKISTVRRLQRVGANRQNLYVHKHRNWDGNPEWVDTTLTWPVTPEGTGSLLRFTQSGWKAMTDMVATCNSTWGELMYRLKDYVEGKNPGPHWRE